MDAALKGLLEKALDRLKSSRVWGVTGANIWAGFSDLADWPKATVLLGTVIAYIVSETAIHWRKGV